MLDFRVYTMWKSTARNMAIFLWIFLLVLSNIHLTRTESCAQFLTCGQCIGNTLRCTWCPDKNHKEPRCVSSATLENPSGKKWCKEPVNPQMSFNIEQPKTSAQFRPQHIKIKLRPGEKFHFNISYKPAVDYPIDIYYLMDNSYSMSFHKDKLQKQANETYIELHKLSNNVRFGVGSFIEKLGLPYASSKKHALNTFINHLPLTHEISKFITVVEGVKASANFDGPESGLDGLMQAMVCAQIGWRPDSRRMIILSTESTYHSAGDGKMVGAYVPNDMNCHLENNVYGLESSLLFDYPSVGQINKVASDEKISIIFAVLKGVEAEYKALAVKIQGAQYVELKKASTSAADSSDLVEMIKKQYLEMTQSLELDTNFVPPNIELSLNPSCNKSSKCHIEHRNSIEINAVIHAKSCLSDEKNRNVIEISPVELGERLTVDVEVLCQCDCEKKENSKPNSTICSGKGSYQCGVCKCNKNSYGKNCQCSGISTEELDLLKCKANKNEKKVCSGRGVCSCGLCTNCTAGYYGDLCQYGEHECPAFDDEVCAGNGECKFNKCQCHDGWNGTDCTCSTNTDICVGANAEVCSGHGVCKCGVCECTALDSKNKKYTGTFCDLCDDCIENRCKQLENYVECYFNNDDKELCNKKFTTHSNRTVLMLNRTEITDLAWRGANWCKKVLADQSSILFKYIDDRNSTLILIQKDKELPPVANIWVPIASAIGAILLIGLLTVIIWKVLVDLYDAREYRKFVEESKAAGYDVSTENPIYNQPVLRFVNPAFNRQSTSRD